MENLQEAYLSVYSPQENIEEGLRSAVQRLLGGKKQEPQKQEPQGRIAQLRQKHGVTARTGENSPRGKILSRMQTQIDADAAKHGPKSSSVQSSTSARNQMLRGGYSQFGMNDAGGSGNKARKREAALNKEEFDWIVDTLLDEGYDLSTYTVDEFYNICLEEVEQIDEITRSMGARAKKYKEDQEQAAFMARQREHQEKMKNDPEYRKRHEASRTVHQRSHERSQGGGQTQAESFDLFDYLLEYLVAEGYADTNQSAIAIMANMSEDWREEILDEANKMEKHYDVPNWEKVYDRNERDTPNHTRKPERRPSGKLETSNQTTKRVGKQRRQDHVDTRGVKQIPGAKGVGMQFGRAF